MPDDIAENLLTLTHHGTGYTLYSDPADAGVRENPDVVDVAKATTLLGTGGTRPWVDRCTVYVFRLPDFGPVEAPFTTAAFTFHYGAKQSTLQPNDLYGLGRRAAPDVLASDYYGQTADEDPSDATRLQTNVLTHQTPLGLIHTSPTGNASLLDYLNDQYASGVGAGDYVFLRLNTAGAKDGIDRATLTMSEGASTSPEDTRPRLYFTTTLPLSHHQEWRTTHFGSPFSSGFGADEEDPNQDGENNYLEFVTGQNPFSDSLVHTEIQPPGTAQNPIFRYDRNTDAVADGNLFLVEWSESLLPDSWSSEGVTQAIEEETDSIQSMAAEIDIERI
ncbi:MAG: hypothetical protein AB8B91_00850, partial [Rubripirellula sp.]